VIDLYGDYLEISLVGTAAVGPGNANRFQIDRAVG
jgi:hypothetical protein